MTLYSRNDVEIVPVAHFVMDSFQLWFSNLFFVVVFFLLGSIGYANFILHLTFVFIESTQNAKKKKKEIKYTNMNTTTWIGTSNLKCFMYRRARDEGHETWWKSTVLIMRTSEALWGGGFLRLKKKNMRAPDLLKYHLKHTPLAR